MHERRSQLTTRPPRKAALRHQGENLCNCGERIDVSARSSRRRVEQVRRSLRKQALSSGDHSARLPRVEVRVVGHLHGQALHAARAAACADAHI
eukprot:6201723-Pleurochrysis_carterae.AAC.2